MNLRCSNNGLHDKVKLCFQKACFIIGFFVLVNSTLCVKQQVLSSSHHYSAAQKSMLYSFTSSFSSSWKISTSKLRKIVNVGTRRCSQRCLMLLIAATNLFLAFCLPAIRWTLQIFHVGKGQKLISSAQRLRPWLHALLFLIMSSGLYAIIGLTTASRSLSACLSAPLALTHWEWRASLRCTTLISFQK